MYWIYKSDLLYEFIIFLRQSYGTTEEEVYIPEDWDKLEEEFRKYLQEKFSPQELDEKDWGYE